MASLVNDGRRPTIIRAASSSEIVSPRQKRRPKLILNARTLASHGCREGRRVALDIIEHALSAVDSYDAARRVVRLENGAQLVVGDKSYELGGRRKVYVIGAGKATFPIARALDEVLGSHISEGIIIVKNGQGGRLPHIRVVEAGHPLPDKDGLRWTKQLVRVANKAKKGDIVLCIVTGGASALMPMPANGITLHEKRDATELLLNSGASVMEVNCVRNHISAIKGGRLARLLAPAEIINFIVTDEVDRQPWGPTVPDRTTFRDAIGVLTEYGLWNKVAPSVRSHLKAGLTDPSLETPKESDFRNMSVQNIMLADNSIMCLAAQRRARELGFESAILTTVLQGESSDAGLFIAAIAKEIEQRHEPLKPPCALILGGETTVTISGRHGKGGPSQELALGAALGIADSRNIVVASIDTDGTDGPTDAAGGIVDGYSVSRASQQDIAILKTVRDHNAYVALSALGDSIKTNDTGTNLMDLNIAVITG